MFYRIKRKIKQNDERNQIKRKLLIFNSLFAALKRVKEKWEGKIKGKNLLLAGVVTIVRVAGDVALLRDRT